MVHRVAGETLAPDELTWRTLAASTPGFAARDGVALALDLVLDDALLREATARELSRAVQDMRKDARLRYGEPVTLSMVGDSPELSAVLDEHASWLAQQCCARAVSRVPLANPLRTATVEVGGAAVALALARDGDSSR
jgi:isoleucyl-tRNA synthetase